MWRFRRRVVAPFFQPNGSPTQVQNGGEGTVRLTLTNAQIKALRATPITVVPAAGAGRVIQLVSATLRLNYGGTNAFTITNTEFQFKYVNGSGAAASQAVATSGFLNQTADTLTNALPKVDVAGAAATLRNAPLVIHNSGSAEVLGNAGNDNTVTLDIRYRVVNV